ncbi:MAG: Hsp33 family molecular chaperone HslO [Pseudomonadota bacterium]
MNQDYLKRFIFDDADVRGHHVSLKDVVQSVTQYHDYPPVIAELLSQALVANVLLATTLKFEGKISLQLQYGQHIELLYVECNHKREVKGTCRWQGDVEGKDFQALVATGSMVVTIEPEKGERYQGIVALEGESLAGCLEDYFARSEQLATKIWLTCATGQAAGLLLQQLPACHNEDTWEHLSIITDTLTDNELLTLHSEELLHRLYHNEALRVFEEESIHHVCGCSKLRCQNSLLTLPVSEIEAIRQENQDGLDMTCQFCNKVYHFDDIDLLRLIKQDLAQNNPGLKPH